MKTRKEAARELWAIYCAYEVRPVKLATIYRRAKNGNLYDEFNCYYISEEEACRSIDWALFILNIIYSNHEKH